MDPRQCPRHDQDPVAAVCAGPATVPGSAPAIRCLPVAVATAWTILDTAGVFSDLQQIAARTPGLDTTDVCDVVGPDRIPAVAAMLAAVELVAVPAAAFLCGTGYNAISRRVGAPFS